LDLVRGSPDQSAFDDGPDRHSVRTGVDYLRVHSSDWQSYSGMSLEQLGYEQLLPGTATQPSI
jgi:hypothetical protein